MQMEFINSEISAKSFLESYRPKIASPIKRGQWLNQFYNVLKDDWNGVEPLTRLRVGIAMKRFNTDSLPYLWKICSENKSFSKMFWWKVKQMPVPPRKKKVKNLQLKLE
jgi:hypothetical protein